MEPQQKITRAVSLGSCKYTLEEMTIKMFQSKQQAELMTFYLDYIRNYKVIPDELLENIKKFDDHSKMMIIREYNSAIYSINCLLCDDSNITPSECNDYYESSNLFSNKDIKTEKHIPDQNTPGGEICPSIKINQ